MKPNAHSGLRTDLVVALLVSAFSGAAVAGRPLVVDDANVNDAGRGQLEVWAAHAQGISVYNVAPAYAPVTGLEVGALLAQGTSGSTRISAAQAKWQITAAQESACNVGAVFGIARSSDAPLAHYLNGLLTCNQPGLGSLHLNLGTSWTRHAPAIWGWGIAYEKEVARVTVHAEWFGAERSKTTLQVGLRGNISPKVQLDGSLGRTHGRTLYTVGTKFQF